MRRLLAILLVVLLPLGSAAAGQDRGAGPPLLPDDVFALAWATDPQIPALSLWLPRMLGL